MRQLAHVLILSILICVFGFSTHTKAGDVSEAKKSIKQILQDYETAWNNMDVRGLIALYHENASIMVGNKKMVSKKQYEEILLKKWKNNKIKLGSPKITVMGEKAKVNVKASFKRFDYNFTYHMVFQKNRWLIMGEEYYKLPKK